MNKVSKIKRAAEILRWSGIAIDESAFSKQTEESAPIKKSMMNKFKQFAQAAYPAGRFTVHWTRNGHLAFWTEEKLKQLQQIATHARKVRDSNGG